MSENRYFQKALSDFTYDAASGGAIRHLTDTGYTVKQIMETLTYPTPYERVQKTVWKHLLDTGTILLDIPGTEKQHEKITYVREYNKYGKASFRKVVEKQEDKESGRRAQEREKEVPETLKIALLERIAEEWQQSQTDK